METVAVYAEHPIKTYGVKAEEGYVLLEAACPEGEAAQILAQASQAGELSRAVFSTASRQGGQWLLCALLQADQAQGTITALQKTGLALLPLKPASLIHLQGPHFGDRYGLLSAVFKGLDAGGATPLALEACMHSIFVVLDPGQTAAALAGLNEQFCAPE